ncbi:hypothetical protein tinsulaeT_01990 [Thalassotalea insulae]|uniref:Alginate export domain-containing protein n=1 Tax=Thalassotalea insulae TaxID=2056778 RepID=A0ABQ6GMN6_9GAMM|nr:alginate export family protein [Thalassotalea insulae]GLX76859.1 hypothetical protein tinsulaeT_01990 [Thalassotalea insulae]
MKLNKFNVITSLILTHFISSAYATDDKAKANVNFDLRYEAVSQDNTKKDADALTLRTKLQFTSASVNHFNAVVEFEDSRVVAGVDDYNNTLGKNTDYSVIADPETTELDQGFIQYQDQGINVKVGRQVLIFDNHRFVGHVGWRHDKQTFDAFSINYQLSKSLQLNYAFIDKRNRIFSDQKDLAAKDHLINVSYNSEVGKITAYSYLLAVDEGIDNGLDTYGVRLAGKKGKFPYVFEFAKQSAETAANDFDANYFKAELGYAFDKLTVKLGGESLGSDGGDYGFTTPLATLHKFNGWSDQFLATPKQGLQDVYASINGKAYGGGWKLVWHDFSAKQRLSGDDDLGTEINAQYSKAITKQYTVGIKYASYSAGDSVFAKVDTDKLWLWLNAKF